MQFLELPATLAVGPVAVGSLMTAAAVAPLAAQGTPEYLGAAIALALISGLMLLVMGLLRLGFLANFLSHPVIAGFITASGVHIAASQLGPLLGIHIHGENLVELVGSIIGSIGDINLYHCCHWCDFTDLSVLGTQQPQAASDND